MLLLIAHALTVSATEPAVRTRIEGRIADLLSDDDYPVEAIRKQEQGTVAFRLEISETGKIASCSVTESSGSKLIDENTCRIMSERARFDWLPAPCFRKDFADEVPAATRGLRMEVQWVVSRGPDTERPAQMPSLVAADGTMVLPLGNGQ